MNVFFDMAATFPGLSEDPLEDCLRIANLTEFASLIARTDSVNDIHVSVDPLLTPHSEHHPREIGDPRT